MVKPLIIGIIMKQTISIVSFCFVVSGAFSQNSFEKDFDFVLHLESLSYYEEGSQFLNSIKNQYSSQDQIDIISYYQGKFEYYQKNRIQAISFFKNVKDSNKDYFQSAKFYSALQYAYLENYGVAKEVLDELQSPSPILSELRKLESAGLSLLSRDMESFEGISSTFKSDYFMLNEHQEELNILNKKLIEKKSKSPFLAGLLSAIVPGAGKYYNGQFGQGTMSLVVSSLFGLQTFESYKKNGPKSPSFIIFGGIFSFFYISNIYGSVVSVTIEETSFNDTIDETILLHMHIPIRLLLK